METNGHVPKGTYAAFESASQEVKDKLVTINCEDSLQSLIAITSTLFNPSQPEIWYT